MGSKEEEGTPIYQLWHLFGNGIAKDGGPVKAIIGGETWEVIVLEACDLVATLAIMDPVQLAVLGKDFQPWAETLTKVLTAYSG